MAVAGTHLQGLIFLVKLWALGAEELSLTTQVQGASGAEVPLLGRVRGKGQ